MPGDDAPISTLAWRLLFHLRTGRHAPRTIVTAKEVRAAQDGVRRPLGWEITRQRMADALEELVQHGYVEPVGARHGPDAARAAPPPYRLRATLDPGDTGLGLPPLARTFLGRLRGTPERVLTAEDIEQTALLAETQDEGAGARLVRAAIAALVAAGYLVPVAPGEVRHG